MSEHKNIYTALSAAQACMGTVVKGAVNPDFKSKYATLADLMEIALPALNEQGVSAWHNMFVSEGRDFMRTTLSHGASDTHISCDVPLVCVKQDMQGMKSATTYAKRIGIESLAGIAPEDDDGNAASGKGTKVTEPKGEFDTPALREQFTTNCIDAINRAVTADDLKNQKTLNLAKWGVMGKSPHPKDVDAQIAIVSAYNAKLEGFKKPATVEAAKKNPADVLGNDTIAY